MKRHSSIRNMQVVIGAAFVLSSLVLGQGSAQDPHRLPGTVKPFKVSQARPRGVSPAQQQSITEHLAALDEIFRKDPALNPPIGFTLVPQAILAPNRGWTGTRTDWPVNGTLSLMMMEHYIRQDTGQLFTDGSGEGIPFHASINDLGCMLREKLFADSDGPVFAEPQSKAPIRGRPTFAADRGPLCIVVTNRDMTATPMWRPVARRRVLNYVERKINAQLTELRRGLNDSRGNEMATQMLGPQIETLQRRAAQVQQQLLAMSGDEGKRDAYVNLMGFVAADNAMSEFGNVFGQPGAEMVYKAVEPNPAFFDASRPTDPQVVVFNFNCDSQWCVWKKPQFEKIRDQMDYDAVAAMTKGK